MPPAPRGKQGKQRNEASPQTSQGRRREEQTPHLTRRDPSLSTVLPPASPAYPSTSQRVPAGAPSTDPSAYEGAYDPAPESRCKRCKRFIYDSRRKTFCGRTCWSWLKIFLYSIMYLIFLSTYTMMFLYGSLMIIKSEILGPPEPHSLIYSDRIGISATPTSENSHPLIWYRHGHPEDVKKYVQSIDTLLLKHRRDTRDDIVTRLGPCGRPPYGYGETPCVLIRINKRLHWSAKPLVESSPAFKEAPAVVQNWARSEKKYWLHCRGSQSYDKEHLGEIKYYPNPPGFDVGAFPLKLSSRSPLVGVQFKDFTIGVSVSVECSLWYESGHSSIEFVLYVAPKNSVRLLRTNSTRSN